MMPRGRAKTEVTKMQFLKIFFWVFVTALGSTKARAESILVHPNFSISVHSQRNQTGHWVVLVDTTKKVPLSDDIKDADRGLSLDVDISSTVEDGTATTRLTSVATMGLLSTISGCPASAVAVTPVTEKPTAKPLHIPKGYIQYRNGRYYKFHPTVTTWPIARQICENEDAHLVIVNDEEEASIVGELMLLYKPEDMYAHSGFNDLVSEGQFMTIYGQPLYSTGFTRWSSGEPNNDDNEDCGSVHMDNNGLGLNDASCSTKLVFVCELKM
ncbi:hemolymph lipopolysaccharide-binding protein [Anabrus simplex]|uniref:hemolymph lipopolysaccharide-binding protein n=1 Tax=Anabrus simplex TaxID=316456 RepID=UPI0035A30004